MPDGADRSARSSAERPSRRRRLAAVLALVVVLLALDLSRPPQRQLSARSLLVAIAVYQRTLSPVLAATTGARCRFEPSCSRYAEAVIRRDGALVGSWKTLGRLARCGPWTPSGTHDPP